MDRWSKMKETQRKETTKDAERKWHCQTRRRLVESEDVDGDAVNKTADTYQYVFPFFDEVGFKPDNAAILGTPISSRNLAPNPWAESQPARTTILLPVTNLTKELSPISSNALVNREAERKLAFATRFLKLVTGPSPVNWMTTKIQMNGSVGKRWRTWKSIASWRSGE